MRFGTMAQPVGGGTECDASEEPTPLHILAKPVAWLLKS